MKSLAKIAAMNLVVLVALLGSVMVIGAGIQDVLRFLPESVSSRSNLRVYANVPWAETHFEEINLQRTVYYDFIGWRREHFSGSTINISEEGFRIVPGGPKNPRDATVHMFGGSTVWGTGADDAGTISALLSDVAGVTTFNFGESAYVAHQNLNLLMKNYALGIKPAVVIFYDGVNEVSHKCRSENNFFSTSQERTLINLTSESRLWRLLSTGLDLSGIPDVTDPYDCDTNHEKALQVADTLVLDWVVAKQVSEGMGARFIAILQPVSFIGKADLSHLPERDERLGKQYQIMYPLIRQRLAAAGMPYVDLTESFDNSQPVYIDFCHVVPNGNLIIANHIASVLKSKTEPN